MAGARTAGAIVASFITMGVAALGVLWLAAATPGAGQSASVVVIAIDADPSGNRPDTVGSIEDCVSASVGQPVEIDIVVPSPGIPDQGIAAYQFRLFYDPTIVWVTDDDSNQLLAQANGSNVIAFSDVAITGTPNKSGDYLSLAADFGSGGIEGIDPGGTSETGPGVLARLTLLPQGEGSSSLTLADVILIDDDSQEIPVDSVQSANIVVGGPCAAQATPTPTPTPTPPGAVNNSPTCGGAHITTTQDTTSAPVPLNCSDPDGDTLTCSVVGKSHNGTATVENDCSSGTYTPDAGFTGDDSFTYKANDGNDGTDDSNTATVTVTVVLPESETSDVAAGGEASTGTEPTKTDPVETTVTSPLEATITIEEMGGGKVAAGFYIIGLQVITTSTATFSDTDPATIRLVLDASVIPEGENENTIQAFKDGVQVGEPCTGGDGASALSPDPCVFSREAQADGDIAFTVKSSTMGSWTFGVPNQAVAGAAEGPGTGVGSLAPVTSSIPVWAAIIVVGLAASLGGAALLLLRRPWDRG